MPLDEEEMAEPGAAAKGRRGFEAITSRSKCEYFAAMMIMEGVTSESANEAHVRDSSIMREEPGPSRPPAHTTESDVSPLQVM